jgi:hypothetical protein
MMDTIANSIKQRLSLREPLCEALDTVVRITDVLSFEKQANEAGLDFDPGFIRWLHPAPNQFRIYWANNYKLKRKRLPKNIAGTPLNIR